MIVLQAAGIFAAMFALDWVWARYTVHVSAERAPQAAKHASYIVLLNGIVTLGYTAEPWMLLPAVLGAFAGTYAAVRLG